ncbi:hypothetical protein H9P43_008127 [Blastocladiella emersonii ATCC 22665]|nr:hypothetical protein H9P43_008127 [Blastocladiella emersonii ATCC 22665]
MKTNTREPETRRNYGAAALADYIETKRLRAQVTHAQTLADQLASDLRARDRTIVDLQSRLRSLILTNFCELSDADLAVPSDLFPEADASGLYSLKREQLVHLLLRKEVVVRGLVRRLWATKRERDAALLDAHRAWAIRDPAAPPPPVRAFDAGIKQWGFHDRSPAGVERADDRISAAVRDAGTPHPKASRAHPALAHDPVAPRRHRLDRDAARRDAKRKVGVTAARLDAWLADPVAPTEEGMPPQPRLVRGHVDPHRAREEMEEEEDDGFVYNVSDDEDDVAPQSPARAQAREMVAATLAGVAGRTPRSPVLPPAEQDAGVNDDFFLPDPALASKPAPPAPRVEVAVPVPPRSLKKMRESLAATLADRAALADALAAAQAREVERGKKHAAEVRDLRATVARMQAYFDGPRDRPKQQER